MMGEGVHLLIDGVVEIPLTKGVVHQFLEECPGRIGMTPILGPAVWQGSGGWCGMLVIAESHIAVESDTERVVHADIFSCKPYDIEDAEEFTTRHLGLVEWRSQVLRRGWEVRESAQEAVQQDAHDTHDDGPYQQ